MAVANAVDYYDTVIIIALNSFIVKAPGGPWGSLGVPGGPWGSLGVPGSPWGSNLIKLMDIIDAKIGVKVLTKVTQTFVKITAKKFITLGPQYFKTFFSCAVS